MASTGLLDALVTEHDRIGSPLRRELGPGLPPERVDAVIRDLGLEPPASLIELHSWHQVHVDPGAHCASWFWPADPMSLDEAVAHYRQGVEMGGMLLARRNGQPVATALAVVDGDAVAIYNVATLPEARGRGIGGAITLAALRDARLGGATLGVLESSEMGYGVYRRIGFREAGRFRILVRQRRPSVEQA